MSISCLTTFRGRLGRRQINAFAGALLRWSDRDSFPWHDLSLVPPEMYADCVYREEIPIGEIPDTPILKLCKKSHADAFFRDGTLKIGSLREYAQIEKAEIGDPTEGTAYVVSLDDKLSHVHRIASANSAVFCTFAGEPDNDCSTRFGYDGVIRINNPSEFAQAVAQAIGSTQYNWSKCVYRNDQVVVVSDAEPWNMSDVGWGVLHKTAEMCRYFVKPDVLSHQCEFRFVWYKHSGPNPSIIQVPDAIQFCSTL